jgi:hypothetical protein
LNPTFPPVLPSSPEITAIHPSLHPQVKRELAAVLLFEPHSKAGTVCKSDWTQRGLERAGAMEE